MLLTSVDENSRILKRYVIYPSVAYAIVASTAVTSSYYGLLVLLMGGTRMANAQFATYGPWMAVLLFGFTIQMTLFLYQRRYSRFLNTACDDQTRQMAASGGVTGTAMLACCAHHLFEILPFLGLGAFGLFFGKYHVQFIELGIASNLVGSLFMLSAIQKHGLYLNSNNLVFSSLSFKKIMVVAIYLSIAYLIFSLLWSIN
jgi:hypothetical protein